MEEVTILGGNTGIEMDYYQERCDSVGIYLSFARVVAVTETSKSVK